MSTAARRAELRAVIMEEAAELCRQANLGRISFGLHMQNIGGALDEILAGYADKEPQS